MSALYPSQEWADDQLSKMSESGRADTLTIAGLLKNQGSAAAEEKLVQLEQERGWPKWTRGAIRDVAEVLAQHS